MSITAAQIEEAVVNKMKATDEHNEKYYDLETQAEKEAFEYWDEFDWSELKEIEIDGVTYGVEHVDNKWDSGQYWEGGEQTKYVYKIDGRYFMKTAYYYSYDGYDWDDYPLVEVEPVEKTITVFEKKG